jgi:[ribosomal protein S18]-alanine N-acetyltransferase
MNAPQLRTMASDDLQAVAAIESLAYPFPWTVGNFADSIASGYGCVVLEQCANLLGYAVVMNAVDDLHLLNITVAPAWQRQGLSRVLLSWVEDSARRDRCTGVLLEVRPSNQHARMIYERLGFSPIGVRRAYYPAVQGREDAIVMRKVLQQAAAALSTGKQTHAAA